MTESRIGVLLVDDHPVFLRGLRTVLEDTPDLALVGAVETAAEALRVVAEADPDVVLLDLQLPDLDGVEVARRISSGASGTRVLVLTMFDDDAALGAALAAGAHGFLLKGARDTEIVAALRTVASGGVVFGAQVAARVAARLTTPTTSRDVAGLTSREAEVLTLIASGASNGQIARRLVLSDKTVRNHISNVYAKLGVATRAEALARAQELGLAPERPGWR